MAQPLSLSVLILSLVWVLWLLHTVFPLGQLLVMLGGSGSKCNWSKNQEVEGDSPGLESDSTASTMFC